MTATTKYLREISIKYGRKKSRESIRGAGDVARFIRKKVIKNNTKEHFILLCLDGSHEVVAYHVVAIGTANACVAHPREVFQPAVLAGAVSIIIAHNHPSDNIEPSREDDNVTNIMKDAGKLLGIKLLDHLIVTDSSYYSYQEKGRIL